MSIRNEILTAIVWALMVLLCLSSCVALSVQPREKHSDTVWITTPCHNDRPNCFSWWVLDQGDTPIPCVNPEHEYTANIGGIDDTHEPQEEEIEWPIYPSDLFKYQEDCQLECKQPTFEGFINWIKTKQ